jgi:hypothetical protein
MSRPSRCSLHQEEFIFREHPRKPTIRNAWIQEWNTGRFCDGLGSNIVVHYSVDPITAREYVERLGNQVHPMIQTLFPNNNGVSKTTMPPFTQLELCSHGLKSMKMDFNIFPGQHSHQI